MKNDDGKVIGGLSGYTILKTMNIEELWVDERYRGQGYGKNLLMHAEARSKENGCHAGQTACFSFQGLDFLKKHRYNVYGVSDVYPKDVKEYYLIKRF